MNKPTQTGEIDKTGVKVLLFFLSIIGFGLLLYGQKWLLPRDLHLGIWIMVGGSGLLALATWLDSSADSSPHPISSPWQIWLLLVILVLAVPLKIYHLGTVPLGVYNDEMAKGMNALRIMHGESFKPFWVANKEFLYFYFCIPYLWFWGVNVTALRLVSVTSGVLAVLCQFFVFKRLKNTETGLVAAALMAVAAWPNCSCHIAERLNLTPLAVLLCVLTVTQAAKKKKLFHWILAGSVAGISLWTFPAYRLMPIAAIAFIIYSGLTHRATLMAFLKGLIVYTTAFAFTASIPLKCNIVNTFLIFYTSSGHQSKAVQSWEQIQRNLLTISRSFHLARLGDMSFPISSDPLIWWPLAVLATAGLIRVLIRFYRPFEFLLIGWLAAGIVPAVISFPEPRRLLALQPLLFGLAAMGLFTGLKWICPVAKKNAIWCWIPVACLVFIAGWHSAKTIYHDIAPEWKISYDDYTMVKYAADMAPFFDVYVDQPEGHADPAFEFLMYPHTGSLDRAHFYPPEDSIPFTMTPTQDMMYLFRDIPENTRTIPTMKALYPNAQLSLHHPPGTQRGYYSFFVKKSDVLDTRGAELSFQCSGLTVTRHLEHLEFQPSEPICGNQKPLREITITSGLLIKQTATAKLLLNGPEGTKLKIDGSLQAQILAPNSSRITTCFLPEGIHPLEITTQGDISKLISLKWQRCSRKKGPKQKGNPPWTEIPSQNLVSPPLPQDFLQPIPQQPASFQFNFSRKVPLPSADKSTKYRTSLIQTLPNGNLLLSDWYSPRMLLLNPMGEIRTTWNPNVLDDYDFDQFFKWDIAPGPNIYLIGSRKKGLLVLSPEGQLLRTLTLPAGYRDIACLSNGDFFLLMQKKALRINGLTGEIRNEIPATDENLLLTPVSITADTKNNCIILDKSQRQLFFFSKEGLFLHSFPVPGPILHIDTVQSGAEGRMFLTNGSDSRIYVFNESGKILTGEPSFNFDPLATGKIPNPRSVTFTQQGFAWITNNSPDGIYFMEPVQLPSAKTDISASNLTR